MYESEKKNTLKHQKCQLIGKCIAPHKILCMYTGILKNLIDKLRGLLVNIKKNKNCNVAWDCKLCVVDENCKIHM